MSPLVVVVTLVAGGLAAVIRYGLSLLFARASRAGNFPWTVLIVNVLGSGLGGLILGFAHSSGAPAELQLIILTGVCGGLTTFSTFSVETIQLITRGHWRSALTSVGLNVVVGLGACVVGFLVAGGLPGV